MISGLLATILFVHPLYGSKLLTTYACESLADRTDRIYRSSILLCTPASRKPDLRKRIFSNKTG